MSLSELAIPSARLPVMNAGLEIDSFAGLALVNRLDAPFLDVLGSSAQLF